MFGAHVKSTKWKYMVNEMFAKARLYNMFSHIGVVKEKMRSSNKNQMLISYST